MAVLTAADLPHVPLVDLLPIDGLRKTPQHALASGRARFAGEAVALVLARDRYEAEDGAELVEVDYSPLPHVVDSEAAAAPGAPLLFPELESNVVYHALRTSGDPDAAFARAAHVATAVFHGNRYTAVPLEGRGCAASYEPSSGELTVWSSTQSPHLLRRRLAMATGIGEARIRVITPDVGGGFGQKIPLHPEELAVVLAARATGRTVVWIEDRRENLLAAPHAKEQRIESELALGPDGGFLALRTRIVGDAGAYSFNNASALIEPYLAAGLMPGVYRIRNLASEVLAVVTNKAPVAPVPGRRLDGRALRPGAPDRPGRPRARPRPCRAATAQSRASRRVPLRIGDRDGLRLRKLPRVPRPGVRGDRLRRLPGGAAGRPGDGALRRDRGQSLCRADRLGHGGKRPVELGPRLARCGTGDARALGRGDGRDRDAVPGPGAPHDGRADRRGRARGRRRGRLPGGERHGGDADLHSRDACEPDGGRARRRSSEGGRRAPRAAARDRRRPARDGSRGSRGGRRRRCSAGRTQPCGLAS